MNRLLFLSYDSYPNLTTDRPSKKYITICSKYPESPRTPSGTWPRWARRGRTRSTFPCRSSPGSPSSSSSSSPSSSTLYHSGEVGWSAQRISTISGLLHFRSQFFWTPRSFLNLSAWHGGYGAIVCFALSSLSTMAPFGIWYPRDVDVGCSKGRTFILAQRSLLWRETLLVPFTFWAC